MPDRVTIDPRRYDAVLFDLDGVVTDTASLHAAAWKELFDEFLARRRDHHEEDHTPFTDEDYRRHVDGKPRHDGIASFLESRHISLPTGDEADSEDEPSVHGLGRRKNRYFGEQLTRGGVDVFESTVDLVRELQRVSLGTAVFSASKNCQRVLDAAGLGDLFPVRVDGVVADELDLPGKPDPAVLLEAARRLGTEASRAVVVEDSAAGVGAGRRGGFALVIGVDRHHDRDALLEAGADGVVADLAEVALHTPGRRLSVVPDAGDHADELLGAARQRTPVVLLDFDGTLSDIVDDPDTAELAEGFDRVLGRLAARLPVAVISGRDLDDLAPRLPIDGLWLAGSHGFELRDPHGGRHDHEEARRVLPELEHAAAALEDRTRDLPGTAVERKRYAVAVHFRKTPQDRIPDVERAVEEVAEQYEGLRRTGGRKVLEVRPDLPWDKGEAVRWLVPRLTDDPTVMPIYAGDDLTDEDALDAVRDTGWGIVVRSDEHGDRTTAARLAVDGPDQLRELLARIADVPAPAG